MPSKNVYFETNGIAWNDYKPSGTATVLGNAIIIQATTSAEMFIDIALGNPALLGNSCGALDKVFITYPDGTVDTIFQAAYGCGTFPAMMCVPSYCTGSFKTTINLSNISSLQGQSITLSATSFGGPFGAAQNNWVLNAYIAETIPETPATMDITVEASGSGLANALIAVTDNTSNQTFSLTTDSSGKAILTGINVGDSITFVVSESGYSTVNETKTVYYASSNVTISLVASTTGQITNILKYVAIAGGVVAGGAVIYEASKAVSEHEAGSVARERFSAAYSRLQSGASAIKQRLNPPEY